MSTPAPIVVAVDFSPHSASALQWAAEACRAFGAPLLVLHVVNDPAEAPGSYHPTDPAAQRIEEAAGEMLASFVADAASKLAGLSVETKLVVGLPATRIIEVSEAHGARLIVVGSRGRTGLKRILLGSKAQRVAELSPIPVTIVKAEAPSA